jgi:hypothetical protein
VGTGFGMTGMKNVAPSKEIEERVGILERSHEDCQDKQDERYGEVMKRVERIENKMIGALGIGAVLLLGIVINIILTLAR